MSTLFLEDQYLKETKTKVTKIEDGKVILKDTIFYPTGGGQECDTGSIRQGGKEYKINKVKREKGEIVHYLNEASTINEGEVTISINWERRYTFMRYHTLLHLIGSVVNEKYGSLCTGNQISERKARIDLNNLPIWTEEDTAYVESKVMKIIKNNLPVSVYDITRKEAEIKEGMFKTVVNLLPSHIENIRVVAIEGVDEQACGGTHVHSTGEIKSFKIKKVKSKGSDIKRLEVVLTS